MHKYEKCFDWNGFKGGTKRQANFWTTCLVAAALANLPHSNALNMSTTAGHP